MSEAQLHLQQEEEVRPDQALTLGDIFGGKLIQVRSGNSLIRWVTGLGIAQILTAVLLMALSMAGLPTLTVTGASGEVMYRVSVPVVVASAFFLVVAWTWLVVGALHARLLLRLPVLLIFLGLHIVLLRLHGDTVSGWIWLALWAGYAIWHGMARPRGYLRDIVVMGLGLTFLYTSLIDQFRLVNPSGEFATMLIVGQIMTVSLLLMPLFMFAGLDLGESVRDVTRWIIGQGAARTGERLLFWVAVLLCLAKVAGLTLIQPLTWGWLMAGALLALVGAATVAMRPWLGVNHEPQVGLTLGGTVVGLLVLLGVVFVGASLGFRDVGRLPLMWADGLAGALAAGVALVIHRRRPGPGTRTAVTFLLIASLWNLALGIDLPDGSAVTLATVDAGAAVLMPAMLLVLRWRGLASRSVSAWAVALTLGLSVVRGMSWLVEHNFDVPAMTATGQLVIFAMGLLWDVLTSGDRWTNGDSEKVPRTARVLLYFGYISLSVAALLFWKASGQSGGFDEDEFALVGLTLLGVPIFLYGFARAGVLLVRQARQRADRSA